MKPTKSQISAVHAVLYDTTHLSTLAQYIHNVGVLMNLNPAATLAPSDPRNPAGSGPNWVIPATGAIDPNVIQACGYCDKIATQLRSTAAKLSAVKIPAADRSNLQLALKEEAVVWELRSRTWKAPAAPADPQSDAAELAAHVRAAQDATARVSAEYFKTPDSVGWHHLVGDD